MNSILTTQLILTVLTTFFIMFGGCLSRISLELAFAKGHSMMLNYMLEVAKDPELYRFKWRAWFILGPTTFIVNLTLILSEFMCYVKIFLELSKNDQRLGTKALGKKAMIKRRKKNVITLYGQVISFIIEIGFGLLILALFSLHYITFWHYNGALLDDSISHLVLIISSSSLSLSYVCTSAELRRHYLKGFFSF